MPRMIETINPATAPTLVESGEDLSLMANRKSAVSQPSRRTAKKTTEARPTAEPAARAPASFASRCFLMFTACFRIQKIIQVSTATAESMATPSKICSARPSSSPTVKKSAAHLPGSRARAHPQPDDGADRAGVLDPQDQGRRRHGRRGGRRAQDLAEAPNRAPQPRLPRGHDPHRPGVHARRGWKRRPREVLQPAQGGAHAPGPRGRVDRPVPPRGLDPLPSLASRLDRRRPAAERARGPPRPAEARRPDRRRRPGARPPERHHRLQLGERARDPGRDRLHDEPARAEEARVAPLPVARRAGPRRRRAPLPASALAPASLEELLETGEVGLELLLRVPRDEPPGEPRGQGLVLGLDHGRDSRPALALGELLGAGRVEAAVPEPDAQAPVRLVLDQLRLELHPLAAVLEDVAPAAADLRRALGQLLALGEDAHPFEPLLAFDEVREHGRGGRGG